MTIDLLTALALFVYVLVLLLLFTYGLNFFFLSHQARVHRDAEPTAPALLEHPHVTVQLPIYNERYVAKRLIDAAAALQWPSDRLEIQVLDDSTDETVGIAAAAVDRHRERGVNMVHIRRDRREGYKAGALARGLEVASGEFIAIFDADFVPQPDFLLRTVPHFRDPEVGFVQTRWDHLNDEYSLFTHLQSLAIDGHFAVEQFARYHSGFFLNFNGTAGVWRRDAIEQAGGWSAATLTEDLDLSYRVQLEGWRPFYLRECATPAELPVTMTAYRRQQYRWARGSFETAQRMMPRVLTAPLASRVKLQALLHLTGYGIHALMFLLALLYPIVVHLSEGAPYLITVFGLATLFNLTAFAPTTYFTLAQAELGRKWWRRLPSVLFLSVLGSGMMVNNVQAILHAFTARSSVFERTPKYGIIGKHRDRRSGGYRAKLSPMVLAEVAMLAFNLNTLRLAIQIGHTVIAVYSSIYTVGLAYVLALTGWHALRPKLFMWFSGWTAQSASEPREAYQEA